MAEGDLACPGCGARLPAVDGPVHAYMESSPACWAAFGRVLAREYATPDLQEVHRLSVDAYAVQHPGGDSRQAIQSVGLHLARLCLRLEQGLPSDAANAAMLRLGRIKATMVRLDRPAQLGSVTVVDVLETGGVAQHAERVRAWAASAWSAWSIHHEKIRHWIAAS